MRVPWWLWPWSACRRLQQACLHQMRTITSQAEANKGLKAELRLAKALIEDQDRQLRAVRPLDAGAAGAMGTDRHNRPDFVMLGLTRPGVAGVRVYASRDLPQAEFHAPLPGKGYSVGAMLLTSVMSNMLVVDKPTYAESMARVQEIWANWDRDVRIAIEQGKERS